MVSDNQPDQYFQFVKGMLLEEVISEPLIYSAYYVNQSLATIQGLDKVMQLCTYISIHCGLYYLKSVKCR